MSLRTTNLNLLPILRALLTEAGISQAAAQLNLSQPATSNALGRLRELLGDPLLVRVGRGMCLTPRAQQLRPAVDSICAAIESLLLDMDFVPERAERTFVVATPDYMAALLGPSLLQQMVQQAPGIAVRFIDVDIDFRQQLGSGACDLAIIARDSAATRGLRVDAGYVDRLVGLVASDHPLARKAPRTRAALHAYPRIGLDLTPLGLRESGEPMEAMGRPRARMTASHLRVLPLLAAQTQGIAVVPEALARQVARMMNITWFALPDPPLAVDLCLVWSPIVEADPAHAWFRGMLGATMRLHFAQHAA